MTMRRLVTRPKRVIAWVSMFALFVHGWVVSLESVHRSGQISFPSAVTARVLVRRCSGLQVNGGSDTVLETYTIQCKQLGGCLREAER